MTRPPRDEIYLRMAYLVSLRATCFRRQVGCVLVNYRGHVLATGYNGRPAGFPHCSEGVDTCTGAKSPSGSSLDACEAIHAEQNALLQCPDMHDIYTAYCTAKPCIHCMKLLLNTSCERIVYEQEYPHQLAEDMWLSAGRKLIKKTLDNFPNSW